MPVIEVDSHVTVVKGLEGTPFRVDLRADGSHSFEFNRAALNLSRPTENSPARARRRSSPAVFGISTDGLKISIVMASPDRF